MNCQEFENFAGNLLEGESHPEAHDHLASCLRCRLLMGDLGAIERTARALPTYEPEPRLWARLEKVAGKEGLWRPALGAWSSPLWWVFPLRPAAVGVLGVMLVLAVGLVGYPALDVPLTPLAPATRYEVARGELVQGASYATRYEMHLKHIEDRVLAEAAPADEELRQLTAGPLGDVDRAIEQTQLRLNSYPEDTLAREELRRLYQQKVTVLQAMSEPAWREVGR